MKGMETNKTRVIKGKAKNPIINNKYFIMIELIIICGIIYVGYRYYKSKQTTNYVKPLKNSFQDGEEFEKFALKNIFTNNKYRLLEKSNYENDLGHFVEQNLNPDFKLMDLKTEEIFWVECKYRSCLNDNKIIINSEKQRQRYKKMDQKVLYLIGLSGIPNNPNKLFLIPSEKMYPELYYGYAMKFEIKKEYLHY